MALKAFFPGKRFPAVSVTGVRCSLGCAHCNGHYLEHMLPAETPEALIRTAESIREGGGTGFLLSGGCAKDGRVELGPFMPAVKHITSELKLTINAHTGILTPDEAREMADAGVNTASVDIVGLDEVIRRVYGSTHKVADIRATLAAIKHAGIRLVPHVCVGLDFGRMNGFDEAVELAAEFEPDAVVVIALMPTKGTKMESAPAPPPHIIAEAIVRLKEAAGAPVFLGCMRPRDRQTEMLAIRAGVDGIVNPANETLHKAEAMGIDVERVDSCCAVV